MMFLEAVILALVIVTPSLNSVVKNDEEKCRSDEFRCADGSCISGGQLCDGRRACPDGSDETLCQLGLSSRSSDVWNSQRYKRQSNSDALGSNPRDHFAPLHQKPAHESHNPNQEHFRIPRRSHTEIDADEIPQFWGNYKRDLDEGVPRFWGNGDFRRDKRQSRCSNSQWRCRNGQCIDSDGKCDGTVNCADGSDEAHSICRNIECPDHLFRCTYGACIDGYAKCDNSTNCADNSDELHPDCWPNAPSGPPGYMHTPACIP